MTACHSFFSRYFRFGRKAALVLLAGSVLAVGSGCTSRAWFEAFRNQQLQECYRLENQRDQEACLERVNGLDYDQYQRQRREAIEPPPDDAPRPNDTP